MHYGKMQLASEEAGGQVFPMDLDALLLLYKARKRLYLQ